MARGQQPCRHSKMLPEGDMMKQFLTTTSIMLAMTGIAASQSPVLRSPAFDVVSVRPGDPMSRGMQMGLSPGGVFTAKNITLTALIQQAYGIRDFQITGGPGWIGSERYDV